MLSFSAVERCWALEWCGMPCVDSPVPSRAIVRIIRSSYARKISIPTSSRALKYTRPVPFQHDGAARGAETVPHRPTSLPGKLKELAHASRTRARLR